MLAKLKVPSIPLEILLGRKSLQVTLGQVFKYLSLRARENELRQNYWQEIMNASIITIQ